jgi:hypothetical protein
MPQSHGAARFFPEFHAQSASGAGDAMLQTTHRSDREALVDIALRLNVLAVCAVFAFVGAVLFGAF